MAERVLKCPVCGKPLTQTEYDKALGLWDAKQEHIQHLEMEQKRLKDQQRKSREELAKQRQALKRQAQEYQRKGAGLTAAFRKQRKALRQQALVYQKKAAGLTETFKRQRAHLLAQNKAALSKGMHKAESKFKQQLVAQKKALARSFSRDVKAQVKAGVEKGTAQQRAQLKKKELVLRQSKNKMSQLENSLKVSANKYEKANAEIKRLQEQIAKGITPQIEGLLEEKTLLAHLMKLFPTDQFEHPGKGGDIIQTVMDRSQVVGKIIYECKKVKSYSPKHVQQTRDARRQRGADYAVLVTNAFPAKRQYYFVEKAVFVISPVSLEPIAYTLRESLVKMALLRLSSEAKAKAVQQVYEYLSGNAYSNKMNDVATQLIDLGSELKAEVDSHKRIWIKRYKAYQSLYSDIGAIDSRLRGLLGALPGKEMKLLPPPKRTFPPIEELLPKPGS